MATTTTTKMQHGDDVIVVLLDAEFQPLIRSTVYYCTDRLRSVRDILSAFCEKLPS